jgi:hypothetical protein
MDLYKVETNEKRVGGDDEKPKPLKNKKKKGGKINIRANDLQNHQRKKLMIIKDDFGLDVIPIDFLFSDGQRSSEQLKRMLAQVRVGRIEAGLVLRLGRLDRLHDLFGTLLVCGRWNFDLGRMFC